ncbi:MAG: AgmX/PglI C-terminal domain-containing protein [bacterium]
MRMGLQCLALGLAFWVTGCGIPKDRYDAQVARVKRLEAHLSKKIDRLDHVEELLKLKSGKTDQSRDQVVKRMTRLAADLKRVRARLGRQEQAFAACASARLRAAAHRHRSTSHSVEEWKRCEGRVSTVTLRTDMIVQTGPAAGDHPQHHWRAGRDVRAVAAKALPAIARCYHESNARRKRPVRGTLSVALAITPRGRPRTVKVIHQRLAARRVARCAVKAFKALRFSPRKQPLFAILPLRFRAKQAVKSRCGATVTRLDTSTLELVERLHRKPLQRCFRRSKLLADRLRTGWVKVSFTVALSGRVAQAKVVSTALKHPATERCLLTVVNRWRFPPPKGSMPFVTRTFRSQAAEERPRQRRRRKRRRRR